ncbi:MAG: MFS transporter [Rhodospirillales bacterium]|nr:MFS transporter [Rhodospirillales bacterium]
MNDMAPISVTREAVSARAQNLVLLAMCLGVLIAQVDTSVVNLAMQPIGAALHASVPALQWVLDAYNLPYAVLLLAGGLIADLYGRRRAFQIGGAVLAIASLGCAAAPSAPFLIVSRAVAGVGAALLVPASLAIIRIVWPDPVARRRALGIWASCNGLAFVVGPILGGFLIDRFGWRSVFFMVIPLAFAALGLAAAQVPESADPVGRRLDMPGQMSAALALGALVFAAIASRSGADVWGAALLVSLAASAFFLVFERRAGATALVPLDLFRGRAFVAAIVATAAMTFGIYGMIFLLPLVWQASRFLVASEAGPALLPCALVFFLVSPQSGPLAERCGVRVMIAGGTALIACGLLVLATTAAGRPLVLAEAGLALTGVGMGLNTGPLMSVAVEAVAAARSGTASAVINVARMVGATLGVAVLGALFAGFGGGAEGLRAAMLGGGAAQLGAAAFAWAALRQA